MSVESWTGADNVGDSSECARCRPLLDSMVPDGRQQSFGPVTCSCAHEGQRLPAARGQHRQQCHPRHSSHNGCRCGVFGCCSGELAARAELGLSTLQLPPMDGLVVPEALETRQSSTGPGPENAFDEQVPRSLSATSPRPDAPSCASSAIDSWCTTHSSATSISFVCTCKAVPHLRSDVPGC
jgi:hypothetical protein